MAPYAHIYDNVHQSFPFTNVSNLFEVSAIAKSRATIQAFLSHCGHVEVENKRLSIRRAEMALAMNQT